MDSAETFKIISIIVIWTVSIAGGLLPVYFASRSKSPRVELALEMMTSATGGVFLAGGFIHLLNDAIENEGLAAWGGDFPYAQLFCTIGFLLVLILEQSAQHYMSSSNGKEESAHSLEAPAYEKNMSPHADTLIDAPIDEGLANAHQLTNNTASATVAISLFVALSFHSVLEGLGLGAQTDAAWDVFIAIIAHKGLASFALGTEFIEASLSNRQAAIFIFSFSLMTVIGIVIGWGIADYSDGSAGVGICIALSAGAFIYVAVMEVIPKQFPRHGAVKSNIGLKILFLLLGYGIFGMLALWT